MTKKQKNKSHRGVRLVLVNGSWRGRWVDPITGKQAQAALPISEARTVGGRKAWAIKKLATLAAIKEKTGGKVIGEALSIEQLCADFVKEADCYNTRKGRQSAVNKFLAWAETQTLANKKKLVTADQIDAQQLRAWAAFMRSPKHKLAATTTNKIVKHIGRMLRVVIDEDEGRVPLLNVGDIKSKLRPEHKKFANVLQRDQVKELLTKWLEHDESTRGADTAPIALAFILTGCRPGELLKQPSEDCDGLPWCEVNFAGACISLPAERVKTRKPRLVNWAEAPMLRELFEALKANSTDPDGQVFGKVKGHLLAKTMTKLRTKMSFAGEVAGRGEFAPNLLRRICASTLTNSGAIYGAASAYRSAQRLGHKIDVAEESYLVPMRNLPKDATTIEAALGIEDIAAKIIARLRRRGLAKATAA